MTPLLMMILPEWNLVVFNVTEHEFMVVLGNFPLDLVFVATRLQQPSNFPRNKIRNLTLESFQADQVGIDIAEAQRP